MTFKFSGLLSCHSATGQWAVHRQLRITIYKQVTYHESRMMRGMDVPRPCNSTGGRIAGRFLGIRFYSASAHCMRVEATVATMFVIKGYGSAIILEEILMRVSPGLVGKCTHSH